MKWENKPEHEYSFRNEKELNIPKKPKKTCIGFTYHGAKLFNMLPKSIKEAKSPKVFKVQIKKWIWENTPSYQIK